MSSSAGAESSANTLVALSASQNSQLAAPAKAEKTPVALNSRVLVRQLLADGQDLGHVFLGIGLGNEELLHLLLLLLRVGRDGLNVQTCAIEDVRNQDQTSNVGGETVSALDGLRPDAKDVVNVDYSLGGILRSHNV